MSFVRLLVSLLFVGLSSRSWSQTIPDLPDRYRSDVAGDRPQPVFDPIGVRLGSFVARADGDVDIGYDSNLFGRADDIVGDGYARLSPSLRVTSDWGRHAVEVGGGADLTRYFRATSQNTDNFRANVGGILEIGDRVTVYPSVNFSREAEPRGSVGNPFTTGDPIFQRRLVSNIGARFDGGRFSAEMLLAHRRERYGSVKIDGLVVSQRFRDSTGVGGRVTLLYKVTPAVSALVQGVTDSSGNPHDEFCCQRDAHGFALLAGARFDPRGLIAGQVAVGYRQRTFEGTDTSSHGLTYDARLQWYPTELLTVSLRADRQFRSTGITAADAVLVDKMSLGVVYEMYRDLNFYLQAERETSDYRQVDSSTDLKSISLRATYTSRRLLQLSAFARYLTNEKNRASFATAFDAIRAGVSIRVRI